VAEQVTQAELDSGLLYPSQSDILPTEIQTAQRVAEVIFKRNLAGVLRPKDLPAFIESQLYKPEYPDLARLSVAPGMETGMAV
jgi:malate dehydrogenase (oxaloacetate-decarboxylating)(NADP+)